MPKTPEEDKNAIDAVNVSISLAAVVINKLGYNAEV
jgi:hypothetical protein